MIVPVRKYKYLYLSHLQYIIDIDKKLPNTECPASKMLPPRERHGRYMLRGGGLRGNHPSQQRHCRSGPV